MQWIEPLQLWWGAVPQTKEQSQLCLRSGIKAYLSLATEPQGQLYSTLARQGIVFQLGLRNGAAPTQPEVISIVQFISACQHERRSLYLCCIDEQPNRSDTILMYLLELCGLGYQQAQQHLMQQLRRRLTLTSAQTFWLQAWAEEWKNS